MSIKSFIKNIIVIEQRGIENMSYAYESAPRGISHHLHKHHKKLIVFIIFLLILGGLVYFGFSDKISYTGSVIDGDSSLEDGINVDAELNFPNKINIDGSIEKIEIEIRGSENSIDIGKQSIDLRNSKKMELILNNYEGELSFDKEKIYSFNGDAEGVSINGVSTKAKGGGGTDISLEGPVSYESLEIKEFSLDSLSYKTSGRLEIDNGKTVVNLKNESFSIGNFNGDLKIKNNKLELEGVTNNLNVEGGLDYSS